MKQLNFFVKKIYTQNSVIYWTSEKKRETNYALLCHVGRQYSFLEVTINSVVKKNVYFTLVSITMRCNNHYNSGYLFYMFWFYAVLMGHTSPTMKLLDLQKLFLNI